MASSKSRLFVVPSVALMALGVLAGCGSNDSESSSDSSASSSAAASSAAAEETSAAASSDSESSEASVEAVMPEGYKSVTAPKNGISFGVPEGWMELNSEAVANDSEIQAYLDEAVAGTSFTAEQLQQQMSQLDLMATATTPDESGFSENVNVLSEPFPAASLPTESDTAAMASAANATADEYSTLETPLGEAAMQTYSMDISGVTVQGVYLIVPAASGQGYSIITVSSTDADSAKEIATNIAQSVTAAS